MSLLMVTGLTLLIYSLAERKLRLPLKEMQVTIPNQLRKPTQTPTIRWVFLLLEGLDILLIGHNERVVFSKLVNFCLVHQQVSTLLDPHVQKRFLMAV